MSPLLWIAVAALGGVGALGRFLLDRAVSARTDSPFPFGTLAVNLSGAFALGLLAGTGVQGAVLLVFGSGLLGSYTTFSTWMFETQRLGEEGATRPAAANLAVSVLAGLAAVALGRWIGGGL